MFEFNTNSLYSGKIPPYDKHKNPFDVYHCRNYTYRPVKASDGNWFMVDTYFGNKQIKVTEENIGDFEFVFDFNDVKRISDGTEDEYDEGDVYRVATDSGGYSCDGLYRRT